MTELFCFLYGK